MKEQEGGRNFIIPKKEKKHIEGLFRKSKQSILKVILKKQMSTEKSMKKMGDPETRSGEEDADDSMYLEDSYYKDETNHEWDLFYFDEEIEY